MTYRTGSRIDVRSGSRKRSRKPMKLVRLKNLWLFQNPHRLITILGLDISPITSYPFTMLLLSR